MIRWYTGDLTMVKKEFIKYDEDGKTILLKKEFEFHEVSYGEVLDIQDDATVIDPVTETPKRLNGLFTHKFILAYATLDGKPCDIKNKEQISYAEGVWLDTQAREYLSKIGIKNQ